MKRLFGSLVLAVTTLVVTAGSALAQTYPPSGNGGGNGGGGEVSGAGGGLGGDLGGTAFTGSDVATMAVVALVLVGLGLTALFVARRRSARAIAA
jgi:hypothetical protein